VAQRVVNGIKTCSRCGRRQPIEDFHRDRTSATGHDVWCKLCKREYAAERADAAR
jgi:hypothetical protein